MTYKKMVESMAKIAAEKAVIELVDRTVIMESSVELVQVKGVDFRKFYCTMHLVDSPCEIKVFGTVSEFGVRPLLLYKNGKVTYRWTDDNKTETFKL